MDNFHFATALICSTVFAWIAQTGCAGSMDSAEKRDVSHRCSLAEAVTVASWDQDAEGFFASDPGTAMRIADRVEGWSTTPYEGCGALEMTFPAGEPASHWRSVEKTFATPQDWHETPVVEYGILASEGPGRDFKTRLTLKGEGGKRFDAVAHVIPTLWRSVAFDMSDCPFLSEVSGVEIALMNASEVPWERPLWLLDGLAVGKPLDLDFDVEGSEMCFSALGGGKVTRRGSALVFAFDQGQYLEWRADTSRNNIYNPPLERRNTVALTLENLSTARDLRLWFVTDRDSVFSPVRSKVAPLPATQGMTRVLVNVSDIEGASGQLRGLRVEPLNGCGQLKLDRIAFEREEPIIPNVGRIKECTVSGDFINIIGVLDKHEASPGDVIEVRHAPLWKDEWPFGMLEPLASVPASEEFEVTGIPNKRLGGRMTHLSSRFKAALITSRGDTIPVGRPFFIENWRDFTANPYEFSVAGSDYPAERFGAKGDGVTNDNGAIQRAIDAASKAGGGRVVLESGREYLATDLRLRDDVELVIKPGAVLRQSPILSHYADYTPEYGHDNVIPGVPWTHCMYTNMPLILAKDTKRVKITGGGTIRMDDTYSENPAWQHYARTCSDRLHIVPIAVCNTSHIEISDLDILRCSNYHTIFYRADSVYVGNLKMLEVACLSGDGLSFGNAVTNVRVDRCIFESNDDGIVLCSSYKDPRGGNWRERVDTIDSSVRHIEVRHSYIDCARGGGGKAIALIPWGSTNPRQDFNEIDDIEVTDCVLRGGQSVGTWPDNPFDGKPFDNAERDDYAPVKNLRILGNEYLSPCELFWVTPTSLFSDCGLHGSSDFKNAGFADRMAYWTYSGDVTAAPGTARIADGEICQGLYLDPGRYRILVEGHGDWVSFAAADDGDLTPDAEGWYAISSPGTYRLGVRGAAVDVNSVQLIKN